MSGNLSAGAAQPAVPSSTWPPAPPADPPTVHINQIRQVYDLLGLDPAAWDDTTLITIDLHKVTVTRRQRNDQDTQVTTHQPPGDGYTPPPHTATHPAPPDAPGGAEAVRASAGCDECDAVCTSRCACPGCHAPDDGKATPATQHGGWLAVPHYHPCRKPDGCAEYTESTWPPDLEALTTRAMAAEDRLGLAEIRIAELTERIRELEADLHEARMRVDGYGELLVELDQFAAVKQRLAEAREKLAATERDRQAVQRVRAIHVRSADRTAERLGFAAPDLCLADGVTWPCPTVAALDAAAPPTVDALAAADVPRDLDTTERDRQAVQREDREPAEPPTDAHGATRQTDGAVPLDRDTLVFTPDRRRPDAGPGGDRWTCPTCGVHATEPHPRLPGVQRCANCQTVAELAELAGRRATDQPTTGETT